MEMKFPFMPDIISQENKTYGAEVLKYAKGKSFFYLLYVRFLKFYAKSF